MLMHKISVWFSPGHDEELARKEALENWLAEVDKRGHAPYAHPRIHLIRDSNIPAPRTSNRTKIAKGFRISVQGYILPKIIEN